MKKNFKVKLQMFMQNSMFVVLFIAFVGLLGYLGNEFHVARDITQSARNTLTQGSLNVLKQMKGPVNISIFVNSDTDRRKVILDFVSRYQRSKPDLQFKFINPAESPKLAQDLGVRDDGEFVVEYDKKTEHLLPPIAEQDLTNLLVRLSRPQARNIMFLDGHGERSLIGKKDFDLGDFGEQLEKKGFKLSNPDLVTLPEVPKEGALLVIAGPKIDVSLAEVNKIKQYVAQGGNLLWLIDQTPLHGLDGLADELGLQLTPGIVVDPAAARTSGDYKKAFSAHYGEHPITLRFNLITLFPMARQISSNATDMGWEITPLIDVASNGWLEKGRLDGKIEFNAKEDVGGPINIAVAMERKFQNKLQRVVVVGGGSFLANTFVTSEGNLDLGMNMVNWLAGDDNLITIQPRPFNDTNLNIPANQPFINWMVIRGIPTYVLPIGLLLIGFSIWLKRRKR
ncbi:MAG TPA: GldG family protein [Methylophilaceae bacterium]